MFTEKTKTIFDRFVLFDTFIYDEKNKSLILSDTHIGLEEYYANNGINLPRILLKDLLKRLDEALDYFKPETIIHLGDVKHEFGTISKQEWFETLRFFNELKEYNIILIKGNHDTILEPITKRFNLKIQEFLILDDIAFFHGHKYFKINKNIKFAFMGHEHPAISINVHGRVEKYKVFVIGNINKAHLIVLPSAQKITEGGDILNETLSPLLKDITNFEIISVENQLYLGKISDLKEALKELRN